MDPQEILTTLSLGIAVVAGSLNLIRAVLELWPRTRRWSRRDPAVRTSRRDRRR
jgi:hypothetical protein